MATKQYVTKKLEQAGAEITVSGKYNQKVTGQMKAARIEVNIQDGQAIIFDVYRNGAENDSQTDYHAGCFCENITRAIDLAHKMESW